MQFPGISTALIKPKKIISTRPIPCRQLVTPINLIQQKCKAKNKYYIPSPMHHGEEHSVDKGRHVLDPRPTIVPVKKSYTAPPETCPSTPRETILV
jgi:hypothetical protein